MPKIYQTDRPDRRVIVYALARQDEIKNQIQQLELEYGVMQSILDKFNPTVCQACKGEGSVMSLIEGCECDGPRLHTCDRCKGTGKPTDNEKETS